MTIRTALAATALLTAGAALAQPAPVLPTATTLTVAAEGRVTRAPDIAEVSGGVVTSAATAAAAMAENASRMTAVVAAVKKAGIADRDIQTTGLNLQPQYRYADNQPPVLTGYQVTNTVSLRLRKLGEAGRLLDTLVGVGANQISGPNFSVDAANAALDEARVAAVAMARTRAQLYAQAAGLRIKRIVSISEGGTIEPGPRPMMMMARADKMAAAPPVAPGEVALGVNVTMVFELE
jgi:uncharacterized protein YggE